MLKLPPLTRNLASALRDATHLKESVRASAVAELGLIAQGSPGGDHEATAVLEKALLEDPSGEVRAAAAVALADSGARQSVPHLLRAVDDSAPRVRQMALLALGELGNSQVSGLAAALNRVLSDPLPALRFQALSSLVSLSVDTEASLTLGLNDSDWHVRLLALRLLGDQSHAVPAPGSAPAPWVTLVRGQLVDAVPTVRLAAALVLQRLGDVEAEQELCRLLNDSSISIDVEEEQRAIERVAQCHLQEATPGLRRRAAGGWWVASSSLAQWPCRAALASWGDTQAKQQILSGLHSWSWQTRTSAALAAGKARLNEAQARLMDLAGRPNGADGDVVQEALRLISSGSMNAPSDCPE